MVALLTGLCCSTQGIRARTRRLDVCEFQAEHWPLTSNASMCDVAVVHTQFGSPS